MTVSLFYNRSFRSSGSESTTWVGSYTSMFHPDYSVLIEPANRQGALHDPGHWLHFDAKYRLDPQRWESELRDSADAVEQHLEMEPPLALDEGQAETFRRSDLYKMHTYRDAVLGSRGAYVLYPGSGGDESIFIRFPGARYPTSDFSFPSVGAFQLRPPNPAAQVGYLEEFVAGVLRGISAHATRAYVEEWGMFTTYTDDATG